MKKKYALILTSFILSLSLLSGCSKDNSGSTESATSDSSIETEVNKEDSASDADTAPVEENVFLDESGNVLPDGVYSAIFKTDSSMFHVNETLDDKGVLTVENGKATIHIALTSKNIVNLYPGLAENAPNDEAGWLNPSEEELTYPDGLKETVNAFDVPVPSLGEEFDLALIGKKEIWYDHKVSVSNPVPMDSDNENAAADTDKKETAGDLEVEVGLVGGSGKASIDTPAAVKTDENGQYILTVSWSSPYYDYMIVDGEKYMPVNEEGNSVFEIPIPSLDCEITVIADTVAMSKPHEIEYTISIKSINDAAKIDADEYEDLKYATQFFLKKYDGGYTYVKVEDGNEYVLIPENSNDDNLGYDNATLIHVPCNNIYIAASATMDQFRALGALSKIKASSTEAKDYSIDEIRNKIENKDIAYVGKYKAPDYEKLLTLNTDLAIESTMIYHAPKIKEELESFNIPVLVDRSSYEEDPLGRIEWIKLYGLLVGKEHEALTSFNDEIDKVNNVIESVGKKEGKRPTVCFFSESSNGYINIRKPADYVSKMIDLAGGDYVFKDIAVGEDNALSTMNISWEDFYLLAKDADILIYNGTIDGGISSIDDLIKKNDLFKEFKAVKGKQVYCSLSNMYQESSRLGYVLVDLNSIIDEKNQKLTYFNKLV